MPQKIQIAAGGAAARRMPLMAAVPMPRQTRRLQAPPPLPRRADGR